MNDKELFNIKSSVYSCIIHIVISIIFLSTSISISLFSYHHKEVEYVPYIRGSRIINFIPDKIIFLFGIVISFLTIYAIFSLLYYIINRKMYIFYEYGIKQNMLFKRFAYRKDILSISEMRIYYKSILRIEYRVNGYSKYIEIDSSLCNAKLQDLKCLISEYAGMQFEDGGVK